MALPVGCYTERGMGAVVRRIEAAVETLLDAIFAARCVGCGRIGAHFCARCVARVEPVPPPWCDSCGATLRGAVPGAAPARCADCRRDPLPLAGVRSAGLLKGPLRRAVHRLKYGGRTAAARALAEAMGRAVASLGPLPAETVLVPVPLHPSRLRERGFNQAERLAAPLAAATGLPLRPAVLRVRATPSQVGLSRAARRVNLRDAFAAAAEVSGATVLLVDDVITTGSTLGSAAAACRAQGARAVYAVTLAREA
ncbi:MAG: ComF family protein [Chloroflexota bacterium]